jgi:IS5 family transposase
LPDGGKLWNERFRKIDEFLSDEDLVERVAEALGRRRPRSTTRGRPSTPAEVVLRMLVLKHLFDWSFEECEREVRASLFYRAFCRIDCETVPDAKTLIRLSQALGPDVLKGILERLTVLARSRRVVRGNRMRVDTTVVETNVHYPTDSTLLADGVRVITRTVNRLSETLKQQGLAIRDRSRSLTRRVFRITRQSRQILKKEQSRVRMKKLYGEVVAIARAVIRDAERVVERVLTEKLPGLASVKKRKVESLTGRVQETIAVTRRVVAQTKARVFRGDTHHPDKVISIFEPHTEAIRKGKSSKPTEFGKLVKIQEAEGQFITDYEVCENRVPDGDLWVPSLERHKKLFRRAPSMATADAAFSSTANEQAAKDLGVQHIALPRGGRPPRGEKKRPNPRWFRKALRWRTGSEGRISALKRRHGLRRCRYRGLDGINRWVGFGVIANNLWAMGRTG